MQFNCTMHRRGLAWHAMATVGLVVLLAWPLASTVMASPSQPESNGGPERCALCHEDVTSTWQDSPHAGAAFHATTGSALDCQEATGEDCSCLSCHSANFDPAAPAPAGMGVSCEACHGPYVEDHPANGVMTLPVESSACAECHVQTYAEWQQTSHGNANVQCTGCHVAHAQDLRLEEQQLCESCHEAVITDPGHQAHQRADVACVECHISPSVAILASSGEVEAKTTHSHRFDVATEVCAGCHGANFHAETVLVASVAGDATGPVAAQTVADQADDSQAAGDGSTRLVQMATVTALGLGLGIGVMLGIIFVLIIGPLWQRFGKEPS